MTILKGGGTVTTDAAPTQGSTNPVQSGGVYSALQAKQDSLSALTSQELETGTSTTARSISAKVLKDYLSETVGDINTVLESLLGNNEVQ